MTPSVRPSRLPGVHLRLSRFGATALVCAALLVGRSASAAQQSPTRGTSGTPNPAAVPATSQVERTVTVRTLDATRQELTTLLDRLVQRASDASVTAADRTRATHDAEEIRRRLANGDFRLGDRVVLTVIADSVRRQEMMVREGPALDFGALQQLELKGILRSELEAAVLRHLSRFYRTPEVRVQFLTRLSITGAVTKPGTYSIPPDVLIADVLSGDGAPTAMAKVPEIAVYRDGREFINKKRFREAMSDGHTVERLGLEPGDEIRVPLRSQRNLAQTVTIGMFSVSILTALLALIRSSYSD